MCPFVNRVAQNADRQRNEEQNDQWERARSGLEDPPKHNAPGTAGQVLEHQQPDAAEAEPAPENKTHEPASQSLFRIEIKADKPNKKRDPADTESQRPQAIDLSRCVIP